METPVLHNCDLLSVNCLFSFFSFVFMQPEVPEECHTYPTWGGGRASLHFVLSSPMLPHQFCNDNVCFHGKNYLFEDFWEIFSLLMWDQRQRFYFPVSVSDNCNPKPPGAMCLPQRGSCLLVPSQLPSSQYWMC